MIVVWGVKAVIVESNVKVQRDGNGNEGSGKVGAMQAGF